MIQNILSLIIRLKEWSLQAALKRKIINVQMCHKGDFLQINTIWSVTLEGEYKIIWKIREKPY